MQRLENWDNLRFFLAVARLGGLAAASRELRVNQSTVSRRIGQLEASLDARLFDRLARGYALTALGEQTVALAEAIEEDVLALNRSIEGADRELRGMVRVTTVDEVFSRIAPALLEFRNRYPGIDLEMNADLKTYNLTRREADVAIRPGGKPSEDDVVGRKLVALPVAAYASHSYLSTRDRPRTSEDLSEHSMVGFSSGRAGLEVTRALVGDLRIALRTNSMSSQAIAAKAGLGVAFLPRFVGDHEPELERLFDIRLPTLPHLWLLIHADLRLTARVRAFVEFMTAAITSRREEFEGPSD